MSNQDLTALWAAWARVDERLARLQARHAKDADFPLYETGAFPGASEEDLRTLYSALGVAVPAALAETLRRWNGRWIAHDHMIFLASISDYVQTARVERDFQRRAGENDKRERELLTFERVIGPIRPKMYTPRRICFGFHEPSGSSLFLDYEDPPEGGVFGQVIRVGEEPIAEYVAPSFLALLDLVADAPAYDDDPEYDPLRSEAGGAT